jgi:hypothetical protein
LYIAGTDAVVVVVVVVVVLVDVVVVLGLTDVEQAMSDSPATLKRLRQLRMCDLR